MRCRWLESTYAVPALLSTVTGAGLVAALWVDGLYESLALVAVAVPLFSVVLVLSKSARSQSRPK